MYSANLYPKPNQQSDVDQVIARLWEQMVTKYELQAILLASVTVDPPDFKLVSGHNLPVEPFNGSEKPLLGQLIEDCFSKYTQPHAHNISHLPFVRSVVRYSQKIISPNRVLFFPVCAHDCNYVFLGILSNDSKRKEIPPELWEDLDSVLCFIIVKSGYNVHNERLKVMEQFVKEIGHDIASCVQATVAKIRNIVDQRIPSSAIPKKLTEIENEIVSAYVISESLGIAVDPNYKLDNPDDYDLCDIVSLVMQHYSSEADERRLQVTFSSYSNRCSMWGDQKAIQQCIGHLMLNAIKYAHSGTIVDLAITDEGDCNTLIVSDKGYYLPFGDDLKRIWDFGFRGQKARELHVNGSGIGLYTVRKIALAHFGTVSAYTNKDITRFKLRLPKKNLLRSRIGVLF